MNVNNKINVMIMIMNIKIKINLPEHQMEQFMAANEKEIMMKFRLAQKRLRMECVSNIIGMRVFSVFSKLFL